MPADIYANSFILKPGSEERQRQSTLLITSDLDEFESGNKILFSSFQKKLKLQSGKTEIFILGDIILNRQEQLDNNPGSIRISDFIMNREGLYYIILHDQNSGEIQISNSLFGMLPVYYLTSGKILISNRIEYLIHYQDLKPSINKKYLLEQYLFNYPLLNNSIISGIKLLDTNSCMIINKKALSIRKYLKIEDQFTSSPRSWKESLDMLSDLFIEQLDRYLPDEHFWITFTGGFDGRTIVSTALGKSKKFSTFAFGKSENPDLYIPRHLADLLGIRFIPVLLDSESYLRDYHAIASKLSVLSGGDLSHLYTHFLHSVMKLESTNPIVVTGYCGSEILRAPHSTGAVISNTLKDIISDCESENWVSGMEDRFHRLRFINKEIFKKDLDELISQISQYKGERLDSNGFTRNQRLYIVLFEEVFRKFFGNLIKIQSPFVHIRLPFLDFRFLQELLKTELAGVNYRYYTNNPLLRYKGQILYATIIRKTNPLLLRSRTVKGYSPHDLFTLRGKLKISKNYLAKRIHRKIGTTNLDNLSILTGIYGNRQNYPDKDLFGLFKMESLRQNLETFTRTNKEEKRDETVMALSQLTYLNHLQARFVL